MPKFPLAVVTALYMFGSLMSCGDSSPSEPGQPTVASIQVTPTQSTLSALGDTVRFQATTRDSQGNTISGVALAWESSDPAVASVSANSGLVTARKRGSATVSASSGSVRGSAEVTVTQVATSIEVTPATLEFDALGSTAQVTATAWDSNGTRINGAAIVWNSSDTSVASVDSGSGDVTAKGNGTADIRAALGTAVASISVTVAQVAKLIAVTPEIGAVYPGAGIAFAAEAEDRNGFPLPADLVAWTVLPNADATVNNQGLVSVQLGASPGIAILVRASSGSVADTAGILVRYPLGMISAAVMHTCRVSASGVLKCWGQNARGEIGDGTTTARLSPTIVSGGREYLTVSTGWNRTTCAISVDGEAYCWGFNTYGRLGVGDETDRLVPTRVASELRFSAIAVGRNHTCAISLDRQAYCWGFGVGGALGTGSNVSSQVPIPVLDGRPYVRIDSGSFGSCALNDTGQILCWGDNNRGQIGDGTTTDRNRPTLIFGGQTYQALGVGRDHACGLRTDGLPFCWGFNTYGQVSPDTAQAVLVPTLRGTEVVIIAGGGSQTCGLIPNPENGNGKCWGDNSSYQSNGGHPHDYVMITTGGFYTCGIATTGTTYCWGDNAFGQLGLGFSGPAVSAPTVVPP